MTIKNKTLVTFKNKKTRWYNGVLTKKTLSKPEIEEAISWSIDAYAPSRGLFNKRILKG